MLHVTLRVLSIQQVAVIELLYTGKYPYTNNKSHFLVHVSAGK